MFNITKFHCTYGCTFHNLFFKFSSSFHLTAILKYLSKYWSFLMYMSASVAEERLIILLTGAWKFQLGIDYLDFKTLFVAFGMVVDDEYFGR
ncbi:hypothetical protein L2E82_04133 [Cichorium intybus]|uniref:Uncharacterized protein n=1 Tax=Cichorium intybus TaxID=13427 RepID=A0ACB9H5J3_CICIN|nr:hypothetical protein L2E82_04133 [Cichorium intybus]